MQGNHPLSFSERERSAAARGLTVATLALAGITFLATAAVPAGAQAQTTGRKPASATPAKAKMGNQKKAAPTVTSEDALKSFLASSNLTDGKPHPGLTVSELEAFIKKLHVDGAARKAKAIAEAKKRGEDTTALEAMKEAKTTYLEAYLYRMKLRAFPNNRVDGAAYTRGMQHRDRMPTANRSSVSTQNTATKQNTALKGAGTVSGLGARDNITLTNGRWEFVGPRRLPTPYQIYYGPPGSLTSGRVNGIAYDPTTFGTAYLTGAQGGVWRTKDNGQTWEPLGDNWAALYATAAAVHPVTGTVYVGLGDYNGSTGGGTATGIMQGVKDNTEPTGIRWTNIGGQLTGQCVSAIAIEPGNPADVTDPDIIMASTGRGVAAGRLWRGVRNRTTDTITWTSVSPMTGDWSQVDIGVPDPNTGLRVYYASAVGGGVFRSVNRGASFQPMNAPLAFNNPGNPAGGLGLRITASRVFPETVYVMDASSSSNDGRIFKSTNAGLSWTDITGSFPTTAGTFNNFSQAFYDLLLTAVRAQVNGVMQDMVYGGGLSLGAVPDGGPDWADISFTLTPAARTHNDQQTLAESPLELHKSLLGNDGGVYGIRYDPVNRFWAIDGSLSATLGITQFYHADWHPVNPNFLIGGTQDNATPQAGGNLNAWKNVGGGDGGGCAINPENPNIQYTSSQFGTLYRTTNNWTSSSGFNPDWTDTDEVTQESNAPFVGVMALSRAPGKSNYLFYGTQYLWRWDENLGDWQRDGSMPPKIMPVSPALTAGDITAISVSTSALFNDTGALIAEAGDVVYVGGSDGQLWMTRNGRAFSPQWTQINAATLPTRAITSISINANNPGDILVGLSGTGTGHVYRLANTLSASRRFTDQSGFGVARLPDVPLNSIARDPADPENTLYVATDLGVFTSVDAGSNWSNATQPLGLPNVECTSIQAHDRRPRGSGYLNVATFGRGMWRFDLPTVAVPNLQVRQTLQRGPSSEIVLNLTITNTGGLANEVQISSAALRPDNGAAFPTSTATPVLLGNLSPNGTRLVTLRFPALAGRRGAAATVNVTITFNGVVQNLVFRTRLP